MRILPTALLLIAVALRAAACGAGSTDTPTRSTPAANQAAPPPTPADTLLASGTLDLPAALAFGDPGFHQVLTAQATLPNVAAPAGAQLVLILRDLTRPNQSCDREHPLSGCATLDWSDSEGRPGVPPGGVFEQRLTLALAGTPQDLFLSEQLGLESQPNDFSPG